jgi:hypothetical protein
MLRQAIFAAMAMLVYPVAAGAQSRTSTGEAYLEYCKLSLNQKAAAGYRDGLCVGAISTITFFSTILPTKSCMPDGVTTGQAIRVYVRFLEQNPARLHEDFRTLAMESFRAAWPCKN